MTPQGYDLWCQYHCDILIIHDKEYDAHLKALYPLFKRINATVEELEEASEWMIFAPERAERAWRTHFGLIVGRIKQKRQERQTEAQRNALREEKPGVRFDLGEALGKIGRAS